MPVSALRSIIYSTCPGRFRAAATVTRNGDDIDVPVLSQDHVQLTCHRCNHGFLLQALSLRCDILIAPAMKTRCAVLAQE